MSITGTRRWTGLILAAEWFAERVQEHVAVQQTPALRKAADSIAGQLYDLYQAVGAADPFFRPKGQRAKRISRRP